jgi:hypothetical protein
MPQHLWNPISFMRICEVCRAMQVDQNGKWHPPVNSICPGDDEDGPSAGRRRRPRPHLPTSGPAAPVRELEPA